MLTFISINIFLFGLLIGSFLNVVICRLKTGQSIWLSRSACPFCGAGLKALDLIPILSFALQKRKCRYCGKKISWQYPLVELSTAALFVAAFNFHISCANLWSLAGWLNVLYFFIVISFLTVIFVYDLKHYLIPDVLIYPPALLALLFNLFKDIYSQNALLHWSSFTAGGFLSALWIGTAFLGIVLISRGKWMGMGDVKLAVLMGLVLGWPSILIAVFLAFVVGAAAGLALMVLGKKGIKSEIPFGPFLSGATVLAMFWGPLLMFRYFDLIW